MMMMHIEYAGNVVTQYLDLLCLAHSVVVVVSVAVVTTIPDGGRVT